MLCRIRGQLAHVLRRLLEPLSRLFDIFGQRAIALPLGIVEVWRIALSLYVLRDDVAELCVSKLRGMIAIDGDPNRKYF